MIKVSIIVPVYNVEKYIDRCLKSLLEQTLDEIEIIIVNDGSTDGSEKEIKKYLNNEKIRYFEKENGGLSSARNFGMKYAKGEYIAFLDSDDYVEKNMYEEMYNVAKKENADMVECDFLWEWEDDKNKIKKDTRRKYKNKREMMKKPRVVAWNKLIKKSVLEKSRAKFPEGLIYEDLEFFYKLIPYINNISYINKYFVYYIQRENSISNTNSEKNADIFKILDNIFRFYKNQGLYEEYKKELKYMKKRILMGSSMKRILKIRDKKLRRNLIIQSIRECIKVILCKETKSYSNKFNFLIKKNKLYTIKLNTINKKICFGITKLGIGGAERVLVDIVNELSKDKNLDITIFTIYGGGELEKELSKNIKLKSIYNKEIKNKFIPIYIFLFRKHIYNKYLRGKHDVNIDFLEGPITRIFCYGNNKKIAWVHNDISKVFGSSLKANIKRKIDKYFYKKYEKIIFVSKQNKEAFEEIYGDISERQVIYNYINKDRVIKMSKQKIEEELEHPNLLTVTRLVKQKGIDRFIRIHKRLLDNGFIHKVYVIGDGKERESLKELIKELKVENSFILLGKKENPYPYIKKADYFVLLSYFEGYGMVLEEAKILDKPIIITDTAAKEAVQNYPKSLILENDEEKIYNRLLNNIFKKGNL